VEEGRGECGGGDIHILAFWRLISFHSETTDFKGKIVGRTPKYEYASPPI
jgi:hypothetical protein